MAKTEKKKAAEATHGGARPNAGRKADPDPSFQVSGRVKGWVNDWLNEEVESGRAISLSSLVGDLVTEAAKNRGAKENT